MTLCVANPPAEVRRVDVDNRATLSVVRRIEMPARTRARQVVQIKSRRPGDAAKHLTRIATPIPWPEDSFDTDY
jgi:hypothetical protein